MKANIQQLIAQLDAEIQLRTNIKDGLLKLLGEGGGDKLPVELPAPVEFPVELPKKFPAKKMKKKITRPAAARSPRAGAANRSDIAAGAASAVLNLAEPFDTPAVAKAIGTTPKNATNYIMRWKQNGWLKKVSFGKYARTPAFNVAGFGFAPVATPTVKPAPVKSNTSPRPSPQSGEGAGTPPTTFAGALKRVVRESKTPMTVSAIFTAIETRWPDLCEGKDGSNVMANLSYAAAQGKCEKLGTGALATFRILDEAYFQETEV